MWAKLTEANGVFFRRPEVGRTEVVQDNLNPKYAAVARKRRRRRSDAILTRARRVWLRARLRRLLIVLFAVHQVSGDGLLL